MRVIFRGHNYRLQLEPGDLFEQDGKIMRAGQPWGITKTVAPHELSTLARAVDVDTGSGGPETA